MPKQITGRIHSIETLGTRDGPGLRCVFFLAGCNYKCKFCQNPDTWSVRGSDRMTLEEAREHIEPLLPYLRMNNGGITVSGGEPTQQPAFVTALFRLAHELRLNTVLDTNGSCSLSNSKKILNETDIVLLDVKASTEGLHRDITGQPLAPVLAFGRLAAERPGRLTLRRVLVPGLNDSDAELNTLADYALGLENIPPVELIPYHLLGVHKWKELGRPYPLDGLNPPSAEDWNRAAELLRKRGLEVTGEY